MSESLAIDVQDLVVRYGSAYGVRGVDLTVRRGQVCGLIGPNGAGKSTTLRVLATLRRPDSGRADVLGWDVAARADRVRWHVGFMPDVIHLPEGLTVADYLRRAMEAGLSWPLPEDLDEGVEGDGVLGERLAHLLSLIQNRG